ncbi:hypothetical protein J4453_02610 [Candidatus Woesearchaeota archaeon]|nr:hypothetical protein [Candidatus Woesearchaeota archaeon]
MDDDLEALKKRRLEELQRSQQDAFQQEMQERQQLEQQVQQLESMVKPIFTKEALSRYGTLKTAHPEKAIQLLVVLAQAIQQGQIKQVNDVQLKALLKQMTPAKKGITITRK